jgi:protein gp37
MGNRIGWCTHTVNPVVGCLNGCDYCYARRQAPRVAAMAAAASGKPVCEDCRTFVPHLHPERLPQLGMGRGRRVFVGSMCDLWGPGVDPEWRREVFMACDGRTNAYLFLTKSPERFTPDDHYHFWAASNNFWLGVTITGEYDLGDRYERIPWTGRRTFVSIEPLLGPLSTVALSLTLSGHTDWAIIGPGTGAASGKTKRHWVEQAANDLRGMGVPVWLKESCFKLWPDMERVQELPDGMQ